jgi:hypothetical protein
VAAQDGSLQTQLAHAALQFLGSADWSVAHSRKGRGMPVSSLSCRRKLAAVLNSFG